MLTGLPVVLVQVVGVVVNLVVPSALVIGVECLVGDVGVRDLLKADVLSAKRGRKPPLRPLV